MTRQDFLIAIWAAEDKAAEMRQAMASYDRDSCDAREAGTFQPKAFYDGMAETRVRLNLSERQLTLWREKLHRFDEEAAKEPNPFDGWIP